MNVSADGIIERRWYFADVAFLCLRITIELEVHGGIVREKLMEDDEGRWNFQVGWEGMLTP